MLERAASNCSLDPFVLGDVEVRVDPAAIFARLDRDSDRATVRKLGRPMAYPLAGNTFPQFGQYGINGCAGIHTFGSPKLQNLAKRSAWFQLHGGVAVHGGVLGIGDH